MTGGIGKEAAVFLRLLTFSIPALLCAAGSVLGAELAAGDLTLSPGATGTVVVTGDIAGEWTFGVNILVELSPQAGAVGTLTFTPAPPVDILQLGDPWPGYGTFTPFDTDMTFSDLLNGSVDDDSNFEPDPVWFSGALTGCPVIASLDAEGVWDVLLSTSAGDSTWVSIPDPVPTTLIAGTITVSQAECQNDPDCDDGQFCNGTETCQANSCMPGSDPCLAGEFCNETTDTCDQCVIDAHCQDTLFCNGAEVCQGGSCAPGPDPCPGQFCNEAGDTCYDCLTDANCGDGLFCNGVETCVAGTCVAGSDPCQPGESCDETADACVECQVDGDCDDALFCNGAETCQSGSCAPGTDPCLPSEFCNETTETCDACQVDADCDDSQFCTGVETCIGGSCFAGSDPCPAGEFCNETTDACDECQVDADCDDALFCNGAETCPAGSCVPGGYPCPGQACDETIDQCVSCQTDPECDDGSFCNGAETCSAGSCIAGSDPCPGQLCDESGDVCADCLADPDCDDAQFCNGAETCAFGSCAAGGDPCQAGELCNETTDTCDECRFNTDCDDSQFCNGAETCQSGACAAGGDPCPGQSCDETGDVCVDCLSDADCDDGQFCTGVETCPAGSCVAGSDPCPPGEFCNETTDACDQCRFDADCSDPLFCNGAESCQSGTCAPGGDPCPGQFCEETADTCVDCLNDVDCDDGEFCNGAETCQSGSCAAGPDPCPDQLCDDATDTCMGSLASLAVVDLDMSYGSTADLLVSGLISGFDTFGFTLFVEIVPRGGNMGSVVFTSAPPTDVFQIDDVWPGAGTFTPFDTDWTGSPLLNGCVDDNGTLAGPVAFSGLLAGFPVTASSDAGGVWDVVLSTFAGDSTWENIPDPVPTTLVAGTIVVAPSVGLRVSSLAMPPGATVDLAVSGNVDNQSTLGVTIMLEIVPRAGSVGTLTFTPANPPTPPVDVYQIEDAWPGMGVFTPFDTDPPPGGTGSLLLNGSVDDNGSGPTLLDFSGVLTGFPVIAGADADGVWDVTLVTSAGSSSWEGLPTVLMDGTVVVTPDACATDVDCDDLDPCTDDLCNAGTCVYSFNTAPCDDNVPCTVSDTCSAGVCGGTPDCSALDDTCNVGTCNDLTGLCEQTPTNEGGTCDEGDVCDMGETCQSGVCTGEGPPDCSGAGDQCNTASCDPAGAEGNCDALTPVPDSTPCDVETCTDGETCQGGVCMGGTPTDCSALDGPCSLGGCDPASGLCVIIPINEGMSCEDDNACTNPDACVGGVCTGTPLDDCDPCTKGDPCDDGDPCTDGTCMPPGFCFYTNNIAPCDDGDPCTETDTCSIGVCAGTPLPDCVNCDDPSQCDDSNPCTLNLCTGGACEYVDDDGAICDDADPCTDNDLCSGGLCAGTLDPNCQDCVEDADCDDGNQCTDDVCGPTGVCINAEITGPCDDGDACTESDTCSGAVCAGTTIPEGGACDDGTICTDNDVCTGGVCAGSPVNQGGACDDGDMCTRDGICVDGVCASLPVDCTNLDDDCLLGVCDPATGLCEALPVNDGGPCDDGVFCTENDICTAGVCAGTARDCSGLDDECNVGECDPPTGECIAVAINEGGPCNDGDLCTRIDVCTVGACEGTPLDCSAFDDQCNVGVCNAADGACEALPANDGGGCDDDDLCTTPDTCTNGVCGGTPIDCSVLDDQCNVGVCDGATGLCIADPINEGLPCDDLLQCTELDTCSGGVCSGAQLDCTGLDDDCNVGICDPPTGLCEAFPINQNGPCIDGDLCTENDTCLDGVCSGTPTDCSYLDAACVIGVCNLGDGQCEPVTMNDGDSCDDDNQCTTVDTCFGGVCDGTPTDCSHLDDVCTAGVCNTSNGFCEAAPANEGGACDDGFPCTGNDVCVEGVCMGTPPAATVSLTWSPSSQAVIAGEFLDVMLVMTSETCVNLPVASIYAILNWDPSVLFLVGNYDPDTLPFVWTNSGFENDCMADGLNFPCTGDPILPDNDGDAWYHAFADFLVGVDAAPGGTPVTVMRFVALATTPDTTLTIPAAAGQYTFTSVLGAGPYNGWDLTGSLGSATVTIVDCFIDSDCDDGNLCTDDACLAGGVCSNTNNSISCDDGLFCTATDTCSGGVCVGVGDQCPGLLCDELEAECVECFTHSDCDDDNVCTDQSCIGGRCFYFTNTLPCDDGLFCTQTDTCGGGGCVGSGDPCPGQLCNESVDQCVNCLTDGDCDDADPCTDDTCTAGDCTYTYNSASCDDGIFCTLIDTCGAGACVGTGDTCPGQMCDETNQACVECFTDVDCDDGNDCTSDTCLSGLCINTNNTDPCDDGLFCTATDACSGGGCVGTGDACSGLLCDEANNQCVECFTAGDCDDGIPCTVDICDAGACVFTPDDAACDDHLFCNGAEWCSIFGGGGCAFGLPPCAFPMLCDEGTDQCVECLGAQDCDDDNLCTDDACDGGVCVHDNNTIPCDDGLFCTAVDVCTDGGCVGSGHPCPGQVCDEGANICIDCSIDSDCDDNNVCTDETCVVGTCFYTDNTDSCDDDNACTMDDVCAASVCAGIDIPPEDCDDGNLCTDDSCDPAIGCVNTSNTLPCDDGNACTTGDVCTGGTCVGEDTSAIDCDDANVCTDDSCDPAAGCIHTNNSLLCDDDLFCTATDTCFNGVCVGLGDACPGQLCAESSDACVDCFSGADCSDGLACTLDICSDGTCVFSPDDAACDDGLFCDGPEICDVKVGCLSSGNPCDWLCDEEIDTCLCQEPVVIGEGSRYIAISPAAGVTPVAIEVTSSAPGLFCLPKYVSLDGRLTDTPVFQTPSEWGTIHLTDTYVEPSTTYDIWSDCRDPGDPQNLSASVSATTFQFADVNDSGETDLDDLLAVLDGYVGDFHMATLQGVDVAPCEADGEVDLDDIMTVLDGFGYGIYDCLDPCP